MSVTQTTPGGAVVAAPAPPVTERLAEHALAVRAAGIGDATTHAATRAVVDWFAATVAGTVMEPARVLAAALLDESPAGRSRLVADGCTTSSRTAALINATASHTAEMDDIFRDGIYHPGSPTVAAALAVAERLGSSGTDLLRAVTIGYDIGDCIAAAVNPAHYRYWHTTGTVGTIGAAAAAADLLGLDARRFAHALATAATMAAGLQQAFRSDSMSKPLHAGHAAESGVLAALAASGGYTGALDILEGNAGFGAGMSGAVDWERALDRLAGPPGITQPTLKNHSCCGHTFAAVDAVLELRDQGVEARDVAGIDVATYVTAATVAGNANPETAFEAKFSTAYCVAVALVTGSVRLRAFEDETLGDPRVRELMGRVTVAGDPGMEALFPGQRVARVTVTDRAGETHVAERQTRKGDPDDPLTDGELRDKFRDLAGPVLGDDQAGRLEETLWRLSELPDLSAIPLGRA
ncbi:MAG TPA: MmgE/PrpD family protein [Trebonia sp.]